MIKISDMLAAGRTVSFEFMPPRTPEREVELAQTLRELEPLRPSFVSITYGAAGSTRDRTHALVQQMLSETAMTPMAHLTCVAHRRDELIDILTRYAEDGLQNILALRGDPPLDTTDLPPSEFQWATELVDLARSVGDFCVAVAMHPEGHPKAMDRESDRRHQAAKLQRADFGITQFFFRVSDYVNFVEDLAALGVDKPVIPGVMPPTNVDQLRKLAALSGAAIPAFVAERLTAHGNDRDSVRKAGVELATELCEALLQAGAPGLHFYTMNRSTATREVYANLRLEPQAPEPEA